MGAELAALDSHDNLPPAGQPRAWIWYFPRSLEGQVRHQTPSWLGPRVHLSGQSGLEP